VVTKVQDFRSEFPICDPETGIITPEFLRFLQERGSSVVGAEDSASDALTAANSAQDSADTAQGEVDALESVVAALSIDDLTDVDTSSTAPTNGQVLEWESSSSLWKPATVSGGGGGSGFTFSATPDVPAAADFPTWVNQNSSTATDLSDSKGVLMTTPYSGTGQSISCLLQSVPSTPYTVTTYINTMMNTTTFITMGLILRESSSGRLIRIGRQCDSLATIYKDNSPTSGSGSYSFQKLSLAPQFGLRFTDDGPNRS